MGCRASIHSAPVSPTADEVDARPDNEINANLSAVSARVSKAAEAGVEDVLQLMQQEPDNEELQWWCCDALTSLSAGKEDVRQKVFLQRGIDLIVQAMGKFPYSDNVQIKGCWALANMSANHAEQVAAQGGIEAVVAGMDNCSANYQVQLAGTRVIANLINHEPCIPRCREKGASRVLQNALNRYPQDGQLQYRGMNVLMNLDEHAYKAAVKIQATAKGMLERKRFESRKDLLADSNQQPTVTKIGDE